jgi:signal transduction histidine kinase
MSLDCRPDQCRFLSGVSHVVIALSADGTIRRVDARRPEPLGYAAGSLAGRALADLVPADQRPRLARVLARSEVGQPVWEDLVLLRADGRPEPLRCCFQGLPGGQDEGLLLTALRLDEVRQEARAEAAAVLAHLAFQCHRPIYRLMQALEGLRAEAPASPMPDHCRAQLDAILDAMGLAALWPAAEPGQAPATDVVRVLEGVLRLLEADGSFARLTVDVRPDEAALWASAHPVGLACVALHLAANARDATARTRRPRLIIDARRHQGRVFLEFTDNGSGLAARDARAALAPFFRGSKGGGAPCGTGLATCAELVRFMGGTLRLQSRRSRGTTVVVSLPAAPAPQ